MQYLYPKQMNISGSYESLTAEIIGAAFEVQKLLGPGTLGLSYRTCLAHELKLRGLIVVEDFPIPIIYKGVGLEGGYRGDLLVENTVIVQVKAAPNFAPVHEAQLLSYLKLANKRVGLLVNFHAVPLRTGIRRMAYEYDRKSA